MDVEFENDPFGEVIDVPANRLASNDSVAKKMRNDHGQASSRQATPNLLNPQLACPIASITPYSNKW